MINIHAETMAITICSRFTRSSAHYGLIGMLFLVGAGVASPTTVHAQSKDTSSLPIKDPSLLPEGVDPKISRDGFGFLLESSFEGTIGADGKRGFRATAYPIVTHIIKGTPAEAAKLAPGDVLLSVNGHDLIAQPFRWGAPPGTVVTVRVKKGDAIREVRLTSVHWYTAPDSLAKMRNR
jgi:S1-C subfamily serine protease